MKSLIKTLALAAVIISCSSPKAEEEEEEPIEVVADTTRIEESPMKPIEVE
jgi:tripartite-type tricarboxylate transporter receptor subunit TctC